MLVPPGQQGVVQIDQLLGQLIQGPPALGVAIDLQPGPLDGLGRLIRLGHVAVQHLGRDGQPRLGHLGQGVVVQAGGRDGGFQRGQGLWPVRVELQEAGVL